jgi:ribosomal protein S18 acetylase RimI-like enzyme
MTATPLSARVTAPASLTIPVSEGYEWRPATPADIDAILDCTRAIGAADHPYYVVPREELEDEFEHSYTDAALDSLIAVTADGVVDAWGFVTLSPGQDTLVRSILGGGVRPSARGRSLGRQLAAWQEGRALQQLATSSKPLPGWIMLFAEQTQTATIGLFERRGFAVARYYLELGRDLSQPIADRELDGGLTVRRFDDEFTAATLDARNDSFRDHWGSQPVTAEQWASFTGSSLMRRDLSFVALAPDGEVAGFVITTVNEEDWPGQGFSSGYIDLVGVRRAWRGKGIAPALLTVALTAIRDAGLDQAVLDVDAANPTGALGLYESVGFAESHRSVNLLKTF